MLSQADMDRIVAAMRTNGVTSLDLRRTRGRLKLSLEADGAQIPTAPATPLAIAVKSPGIGQFLRRGGDDGLPDLPPDATVTQGEVLGYLCQGAARILLCAPADGMLRGPLPAPGSVLGYGDTLFLLEPTS